MKTTSLSCALLAIALVGCAAPKKPLPPLQLSAPSEEQKRAIMSVVAASLKDPDSAKFGRVGMLSNTKGACIEVNAKNSYGGYTGIQSAALGGHPEAGWFMVAIKNISLEDCLDALRSIQ